MADQELSITYRGPAVEAGRMPVRELAPALLALGELLEEGNSRINPGMPPVSLDVQAAEIGSFHLTLILTQMSDQSINLLTSQGTIALSNLVALVSGTNGVLNYMRRKFGREEVSREALSQGMTRVVFADGTTAEAMTSAIDMATDLHIRRTIRSVISPLGEPGVEEIVISARELPQPDLVITQADAPAYLEPDVSDEVTVPPPAEIRTLELRIDKPDLNNRNGAWRFSSAIGGFWARVKDDDFLDRVQSHDETFGTGDLLRCDVQFEKIVDGSGELRDKVEVLHVISKQPPLEHHQSRFDA